MARFRFDTSVIKDSVPDWSGSLRFLGESLDERNRRRADELRAGREEDYRKAQIAQMKAGEERDKKRLGFEEERLGREKTEADRETAKYYADEAAGISKMLGAGQKTEAGARAKAIGGELQEVRPELAPDVEAPEAPRLREPDLKLPEEKPPSLLPSKGLQAMGIAPSSDEEKNVARGFDETKQALADQRQVETAPSTFNLKLGGKELTLNPAQETKEERNRVADEFYRNSADGLAKSLGPRGAKLANLGAEMLRNGADQKQVDGIMGNLISQAFAGEVTDKDIFNANAAYQRALIAATTRQTVKPGEEARIGGSALTNLENSIDKFSKLHRIPELIKEQREAKDGLRRLASGSPLDEKAAQYAIGKAIAGVGVYTQEEHRNIMLNVGGKFESWNQMIQSWVDGRLTPAQNRVIENSIRGKLGQINKVIDDQGEGVLRAFEDKFLGPGSGYEEARANVINRRNSLFRGFGVKPMPVSGPSVGVGIGRQSDVPELGDDAIDMDYEEATR